MFIYSILVEGDQNISGSKRRRNLPFPNNDLRNIVTPPNNRGKFRISINIITGMGCHLGKNLAGGFNSLTCLTSNLYTEYTISHIKTSLYKFSSRDNFC